MTGKVAKRDARAIELEAFNGVLEELATLHGKKSADYGSDADPLANIHSCAEFGVQPWKYAVMRINDNIWRLKAFVQKGQLENDPPEDSLKDIATFAILALLLLREEK